jgi:multiple RNA-binding domain-containing protein 1
LDRPKKKTRTEIPSEATAAPEEPAAGPSKRLQEFMDVMKGVDPTAPIVETTTNVKEKSRKGKERSPSPQPTVAVEEDDDAAWLAKRRGRVEGGDEGDGGAATVSHSTLVACNYSS